MKRVTYLFQTDYLPVSSLLWSDVPVVTCSWLDTFTVALDESNSLGDSLFLF